MAIGARVVTVSTTATQISTNPTDSQLGQSLLFKVPTGGSTVYLGGPDVTASGATQGVPVDGGEWSPSLSGFSGKVFAIVASGTQDVNVLEEGI